MTNDERIVKTYCRIETSKLRVLRVVSIYGDKIRSNHFLLILVEGRRPMFKMIMARVLRPALISQINNLIVYIIDCNLYILMDYIIISYAQDSKAGADSRTKPRFTRHH